MPQDSLSVASDVVGTKALQARYGTDQAPPPAWNPVLDALMSHRSVRTYLTDALPKGTTELLVAAAQSAATSSNMQTWSVVAVEDQARRDRLAVLANHQKHISQAPLFLLFLADLSRADRIGTAQGTPMKGTLFTESFMVALIDAALAAQNATVAAESMGLGTVYIGSMRNHPEKVAAELGLPPNCMVAFGLCVGRPDPAVPTSVKPRLPQSMILHHEQYDAGHDAAGLAEYETTFSLFQKQEGLPPSGWVSRVLDRLGTVKGIGGRERMRDALKALGIPLA
jgi:nitroreductase